MKADREAQDAAENPQPGRRDGLWRKVLALTVVGCIALMLAVGVALVLLQFTATAQHATQALRSARPWLISAHLILLGLAWHFWPGLVARLGRWRHLTPKVQAALVQGRTRIFILLAACELLIVLRAVSA